MAKLTIPHSFNLSQSLTYSISAYFKSLSVGNLVKIYTDFKTRLGNHNKAFNHRRYGRETKLSTHIWELKDRGSAWAIKWRILDRGNTYNPATKVCNLCNKEKYWIIYHRELASLNSRNEVGTKCMHKRSKMIGK